jgi:hypothetical protein
VAKVGEDALANMARLGLEELRAANAGAMAMDAPPVVVEAPVVEKPSYAEALNQLAAMSEGRGDEQDRGRSR